jgi:hypothetical protein
MEEVKRKPILRHRIELISEYGTENFFQKAQGIS